ncbi:hypothetical protein [Amycolatopsis panacis]|uniref:hypothetical protein n=1 Tax=Amycolatopsis panacis TaxID=2340917 RepID=UPI001F47FA01|nr:hypothetical protein [Amycolatopsis panacis]
MAVRVEHRFTLEEAVTGILAAGCGDPLRGVGELSVRRVRAALRDVVSGQARERPGARRHRLADDVQAELVRIRLFSDPATVPRPHPYEFVAVSVEHQFTLDEATAAVMAAKPMVRPGPGRHIVPLTAREVREALCFAARHGTCGTPIRLRPESGDPDRLATWTRDELIRLRVFTGPATAATP